MKKSQRQQALSRIADLIAELVHADIAMMTEEERRHLEYTDGGHLVVDHDRYPWNSLRARQSRELS